jgi:predicted Fe-Mo cluster-binding NifX family protein
MEEPMKTRSAHIFMIGFIFVLFSVFAPKTQAETMKIAVASPGQTKDAAISRQAGRAPFFLLFDDRGTLLESIENPARGQSRRAGPGAALFLADQGVTLVIAGEFGNKMKQALEEHHIHYVEKTGVVDHVVQTIIQDR